ncbi:MAG TPA: hypothetical protein GXZ82_02255 [Firmicutes bacterium]|nr:hypothetical protein [Bacillota bacterium]
MKRVWFAAFVVTLTVLCTSVLALGASYPNLSVTIPKVSAPVIDGKLNDAAWLTASIAGGKYVVDASNMGDQLTQYPRVAYVGYDDNALYVAVMVFTPDVAKLVGEGPNWWTTDEVEIFVDPFHAGAPIQIGITSAGHISVSDVDAVVSKEGIRWIVEAAIPWSAIGGIAPKPGDKWGINFCGRQMADGDMWLAYNVPFGAFRQADKMADAVFGE